MKRRVFVLWCLAVCLPGAALAQVHAAVLSDADQALLVRVGEYLNALRTLKGRFLQVAPDGATSQGTVWLDRPGRMRFQYDPPSPLLLVAGHGSVVVHDSKLDADNTLPLNQTPLGLLLGERISLSGDVSVTDFQHPPGQVLITLVRTKAPGEGSLTLVMNAEPLALVGWSVVDGEGRETRLRLSGVQLGGRFDDALFTYTPSEQDK
jgi:outer membrane lipoprotein-sorting protein